jgi:hypothetical protein
VSAVLAFRDAVPDLPDQDRRDRPAIVGRATGPAADDRTAASDGLGGHGRGISFAAERIVLAEAVSVGP